MTGFRQWIRRACLAGAVSGKKDFLGYPVSSIANNCHWSTQAILLGLFSVFIVPSPTKKLSLFEKRSN
ncbi:hypothetical protein L596_025234 [Steinernema carpocapsae]|uniref:Uncharacterized protein n=1 Tax=Steinernema carpocapsae TaxID=34508 RepID=A0A4U5M774_STECR|nr:hypothetical protein L596_025234 [Steinernema carpocapsae]